MNINIFLKQFRAGNKEVITIITEGNIAKVSLEQLKAFEKLLPDRSTVSVATILYRYYTSDVQIDVLKSYDGDKSILGSAEDFLLQLIEVDK